MKTVNAILLGAKRTLQIPWAKIIALDTQVYCIFSVSSTHLTHTDEGFIGGVATAEFICCINLMEKIGGLSHKFA